MGYQSEGGNGPSSIGYHDDVALKRVAGYHNCVRSSICVVSSFTIIMIKAIYNVVTSLAEVYQGS